MPRDPHPPLNRRHNPSTGFPDDWSWPKVVGFLLWHPRTLAFVALLAVCFEMAWCHGLLKGMQIGAVENHAEAASVPEHP